MTASARLPAQEQAVSIDLLEIAWEKARNCLLRLQNPTGYWVGELQGDSILESEYMLLKFILEQEHDPDLPKIANYLRSLQNDEGGWSLFPGGPSDLSGTVKAYFALKLMGDDPNAVHMKRARRSCSGAGRRGEVQQLYQILLRGARADQLRRVSEHSAGNRFSAEMVLFQSVSRFGLDADDDFAAFVCDNAALYAAAARRHGDDGIVYGSAPPAIVWLSRRGDCRDRGAILFLRVDQLLKAYDQFPIAAAAAKRDEGCGEMVAGSDGGSEGLGAIFPPMVYMLIVLRRWDIRRAIRGWSKRTRICGIFISRRGTRSACSRAFRRCGIRVWRCTPWRSRDWSADSDAARARDSLAAGKGMPGDGGLAEELSAGRAVGVVF